MRAEISGHKRAAAANVAVDKLIKSALFNDSQHIACYVAQKNEFDCAPIIHAVWQAKKKCYLPKLTKGHHHNLEFSVYEKNTPLRFNRYNIAEPDSELDFPKDQLDLVLMPLVGFDLRGHRLGMGGGYYDRTFQFVIDQKVVKPFMLGLAYEAQQVPRVPIEKWDVPMNGVLTEERLYLF